jgi:DNA-binding NtrC family response regulator
MDKLKKEEFKKLLVKRDYYNKKLLFKAYVIADGNISDMAKGLGTSRVSLYKHLREVFGWDYEPAIEKQKIKLLKHSNFIGIKTLMK